MLFELLTGRTPFSGQSPFDVVMAVRDTAVPSPLTLEPRAPRALAAICARALERDPAQRYPDAGRLAADLRAFLEHRQVQAYSYSAIELLRLFVERSKTTAAVAGIALVLLLAAFAGLVITNRRAAASLAEAFVEKARLAEAGLRWDEAAIWYAAAFESSGRRDAATGAWLASQRPAAQQPRRLRGHTRGIKALAASPDGERLASAGSDMTIRVWRVREGLTEAVLSGHLDSITGLAFSRDGSTLWSVSEDRTVRRWHLPDTAGELIATLPDRLNAIVLEPSDGRALVACEAGEVFRVAPGTAPVVFGRHLKPVYSLALAPSGEELFSGSYAGDVKRWRLSDGALLSETAGHVGSVLALAISRDGKHLASAGRDTTVRVWSIEPDELKPLHFLNGHTQRVYGLAWGQADLLASVSSDGTSRVWDGLWGLPLRSESRGEADELVAALFLPGETLVSAGRSGVISLRRVHQPTVLPRPQMNEAVQLLPDGQLVAAVFNDFVILDGVSLAMTRRWASGPTNPAEPRPGGLVGTTTDGQVLVGYCGKNCLSWWDLKHDRFLGTTAGHRTPPNAIAASADGRFLASVGIDPAVRVFDAVKRTELRALDAHRSGGFGVAFSPDSQLMATSDYDKRIALWRTVDFTAVRELEGHEHGVRSVRFSPDGTRLASGSWDRSARIWHVETGAELARLYHQDFVFAVAWHPDGRRLATASHDGAIRIWDTIEGREVLRFPSDEAQPTAVRFSNDGRVLYYEGRGVHRIELEPPDGAPGLAELLEQSGLGLMNGRLVPRAVPLPTSR
jgi:WD40 repeat protein